MPSFGKVVGGQHVNATITTNGKGQLALSSSGFRRTPNLTADAVASWEEVFLESRGNTADAVRNIGQAVARVALPGAAGKAASAAVSSTVDSVVARTAMRSVRVDWLDGNESLIQLPDKLFQHLAIVLKDRRIASVAPAPTTSAAPPTHDESPGVIGQFAQLAEAARAKPLDVTEQIAKLAALHQQGILTEAEFTAKKSELLGRI